MVALFAKGMGVPVLVHFEGVAFQQATTIKSVKSIAELGKKVPVMGNKKKGLVKTGENIEQPVAAVVVQVVGGLIHEQDGWFHGKNRSQGDQTFLSPGKPVGNSIFVSAQPHPLKG